MKKALLALAATSVLALANDTTIDATMGLMTQGIQEVQNGFINNDKKEISRGIEILHNANAIFEKVDVTTFIPNNKRGQVTKNISKNFSKDVKALKKSIEANDYNSAAKQYGQVISNCMACHKIVRGQ
jgi:L-cystine uptake protein TcyP (sodium:dicarboxylate symporter family)